MEIQRRRLRPEHPYALSTLSDFAPICQRQGKYAQAEKYGAQALAGRRHTFGSDNPHTMASAADLALAYLSQGKFAESEPLACEALEFNRKKQPDDWQRFRSENLVGASLAGQKKYAKAEPLLRPRLLSNSCTNIGKFFVPVISLNSEIKHGSELV